MTAPDVIANVASRREKHEVRIELVLAGALPVIDDPDHLATRHPIAPHKARITYVRGAAPGWTVYARVYGKPVDAPTLMNGWADYFHNPGTECDWPGWLSGMADEQHPDRPGGWPGDDPSGSYL